MNSIRKTLLAATAGAALLAATMSGAQAGIFDNLFGSKPAADASCPTVTKIKLGVSIYVGWQPWYYLKDAKGADNINAISKKYCVNVEVVPFATYGASIDAYTAKQVDALVITNMDTLMSPISSGVGTTAVVVGDYSDGNDAVLSKDATTFTQLKGKTIYRMENTVTDYLIAKGLEKYGMQPTDVKLSALADEVHESSFKDESLNIRNIGTWNPMTRALQQYGTATHPVNTLFTSHEIPEQILDLLVVRTDVLEKNSKVGDALTASWYHAMDKMVAQDATALGVMAATAGSGSDLDSYNAQLKTTHMYYNPADAVSFTTSQRFIDNMKLVRDFTVSHGMMTGVTNSDDVAVAFPNGKKIGNGKALFNFDVTYMKKAADGQLK